MYLPVVNAVSNNELANSYVEISVPIWITPKLLHQKDWLAQ